MEFKDIENFLNFYNIGLFFAVVILLYITVIGGLIVSIVNDKTYTEEKSVKKIMQNIIDINNIVMRVLIGIFSVAILGIISVAYSKNENTLNALTDNKFTLSALIVLIAVMVAMNSLCKYIRDIKETDLYKHGSGMLGGGISAIIVIVIVVFIWYRKNTSRPTIPTTSTPIIPTQRIPALPTSRTFPTQRLPALPTQRIPATTSRPAIPTSRTTAAAAAA